MIISRLIEMGYPEELRCSPAFIPHSVPGSLSVAVPVSRLLACGSDSDCGSGRDCDCVCISVKVSISAIVSVSTFVAAAHSLPLKHRRSLKFDPTFPIRGLFIDKQKGNLLKVTVHVLVHSVNLGLTSCRLTILASSASLSTAAFLSRRQKLPAFIPVCAFRTRQ